MYPLLVATLLVCGAAVHSVTIETLGGTENFNDFIQKNRFTFVLFHYDLMYQHVFPKFKEAMEQLPVTSSANVKFASVNFGTDINKGLGLEYIGNNTVDPRYLLPRIFCFKKNQKPGDKEIFDGDRIWSREAILAWMKNMMGIRTLSMLGRWQKKNKE